MYVHADAHDNVVIVRLSPREWEDQAERLIAGARARDAAVLACLVCPFEFRMQVAKKKPVILRVGAECPGVVFTDAAAERMMGGETPGTPRRT